MGGIVNCVQRHLLEKGGVANTYAGSGRICRGGRWMTGYGVNTDL